ncbi:NAD(P)/FAD-dependent oxidoreductase [uncultured Finegoldia sp.]|uniref:NAD(P)/FAD-dependent oxidoreductase n=1 Tax=uncultured Finegoldia sp. TaxID=328009 RepID=UPI00261E905D|nr:NAD(P)/FAD-dependent oxidoreductase [uncultured Finegoldia sp.]
MKVAIIGAGAAGLMAASFIEEKNDIYIFDQNEKIGKKLYITGKGRCNITNDCEVSELIDNINTNKYFCYSAFYDFTNQQVINFFNQNGLKTKVERGKRVFPNSDKSSDVIKVFSKIIEKKHINVHLNEKIKKIYKSDSFYLTSSVKEYKFDKIIIACGGKSYPNTGSDGSLFNQIKNLGHSINTTKPGLCPIILQENVSMLEGVSLKNIGLKCYVENKLIYNETGELVFTKRGISGPLVLTLSSILCHKNGKTKISIDLKPALTEKKLDDRILRDFNANSNKTIENAISKLTTKKLILPILKLSNINPDKKVNEITKIEREKLLKSLKNFDFNYISNEKLEYAIISVGGIDVNEIDPSTMESKLVKNLYFCGEIIDVDGFTGGFNLQFAFSTGYLAGINI